MRRSQAAASPAGEDVGLLRALSVSYKSALLKKYFLEGDEFQRRCALALLAYLAAPVGQRLVVDVLFHCLTCASTDDDLAAMMEFLREAEAMGGVQRAYSSSTSENPIVAATLKAIRVTQAAWTQNREVQPARRLLGNLVRVLLFEDQQRKGPVWGALVFGFKEAVLAAHQEMFKWLAEADANLRTLLLKLLRLAPPGDDYGVPATHRATKCLTLAFFNGLKEGGDDLPALASECSKSMLDVAALPSGTPMLLRFLLEGALESEYSRLFGGRPLNEDDVHNQSGRRAKHSQRGKALLDENLRFGSMPAHPLGATTVFHAGVIGDGRREGNGRPGLSKDVVETNQFAFLAVLFKICHGTSMGEDATKFVALTLVEMVSPDVMYNGLPWPDEDFAARVTAERDLRVAAAFDRRAPILWKLMAGVAEARPALCYCSVLLRALMAAQLAFWGGSAAAVGGRARDHPRQLAALTNILELMSVGQFLPHPLNALADVVAELHPFHVHCVLQDVWAFVRDHVPSPVDFTPGDKASGTSMRDFREESTAATTPEPQEDAANNGDKSQREGGSPYRAYTERLRLIMAHMHLGDSPGEFARFFVDAGARKERDLKMAMDY